MFDLEREIQRWRRELLACGLGDSEAEELEDHLRTDIEEQLRSGVAVAEAFKAAAGRIGRACELKAVRSRQTEGGAKGECSYAGQNGSRFVGHVDSCLCSGLRISDYRAQGFNSEMPYTPRLNQALRLAGRAAALDQKQIDTEHVVIGLLNEKTGVAAQVLGSVGLSARDIRSSLT